MNTDFIMINNSNQSFRSVPYIRVPPYSPYCSEAKMQVHIGAALIVIKSFHLVNLWQKSHKIAKDSSAALIHDHSIWVARRNHSSLEHLHSIYYCRTHRLLAVRYISGGGGGGGARDFQLPPY